RAARAGLRGGLAVRELPVTPGRRGHRVECRSMRGGSAVPVRTGMERTHMKPTRSVLGAFTLLLLMGSYLVLARQAAAPQGRGAQAPPQPMSFFVTSVGKGDGANLGGLAGADAYCQTLATAAGRGA